jgi:hypothetical protein
MGHRVTDIIDDLEGGDMGRNVFAVAAPAKRAAVASSWRQTSAAVR